MQEGHAPYVLLDALLAKNDYLINTSATGRKEIMSGAGEFRASFFGQLAAKPSRVFFDWRQDVTERMRFEVPDWSGKGWSAAYFDSHFRQQTRVLHDIAAGALKDERSMKPVSPWLENDAIINAYLTTTSRLLLPYAAGFCKVPCSEHLESLDIGQTYIVDATFHCGIHHTGQKDRVFSIEIIKLEKVPAMDITRDLDTGVYGSRAAPVGVAPKEEVLD